MVFLHLFNRDSQIDLYDSCFFINGHPLSQCFAGACNPVGMFLFLSGYGMFYSFKRKNPLGGGKARLRRMPRMSCVIGMKAVLQVKFRQNIKHIWQLQ